MGWWARSLDHLNCCLQLAPRPCRQLPAASLPAKLLVLPFWCTQVAAWLCPACCSLAAAWASKVWTRPACCAPACLAGNSRCCAACCGRVRGPTAETMIAARHCTSQQVGVRYAVSCRAAHCQSSAASAAFSTACCPKRVTVLSLQHTRLPLSNCSRGKPASCGTAVERRACGSKCARQVRTHAHAACRGLPSLLCRTGPSHFPRTVPHTAPRMLSPLLPPPSHRLPQVGQHAARGGAPRGRHSCLQLAGAGAAVSLLTFRAPEASGTRE